MNKKLFELAEYSKSVNMRAHPLVVVPLFLALVGLIILTGFIATTFTVGLEIYLTIVFVFAFICVGIAAYFRQGGISHEAKQVPIENFSIWADVGEPAAELRRLNFGDVGAAMRIVAADLGSLLVNTELLGARISILLAKEGFSELREEKLGQNLRDLASNVSAIVKKLRTANILPAETVNSLEQCASQSDRIANKLFEFERGKSEVVRIYVEPLRRAAEKLARDLRLASANLANFTLGKRPKEKRT